MGLFARYSIANSGPGSLVFGPVRQSYSGGLQWQVSGTGDRISAWGLGFSQAFGIPRDQRTASERVLETYYRWQAAENFALSPDFQLVFGSGGETSDSTHGVFGMRMHFGY